MAAFAGRGLPPKADFRNQDKTLAMSVDGAIVDFGFEVWGKSPLRFDLRARKLSHDPPPMNKPAGRSKTDFLSNVGKTSTIRHSVASQSCWDPMSGPGAWPSIRTEAASCLEQNGPYEPTTQGVIFCGIGMRRALSGR
jgi:hypothetical protein